MPQPGCTSKPYQQACSDNTSGPRGRKALHKHASAECTRYVVFMITFSSVVQGASGWLYFSSVILAILCLLLWPISSASNRPRREDGCSSQFGHIQFPFARCLLCCFAEKTKYKLEFSATSTSKALWFGEPRGYIHIEESITAQRLTEVSLGTGRCLRQC